MYRFDVSYPKAAESTLQTKQDDILMGYKFHGKYVANGAGMQRYHNTIYTTDKPAEIAQIASSLKSVDQRIFIGSISKNGQVIYYHPTEIAKLTPVEKQQYITIMQSLSPTERILHDYLVNLYHTVPT